MLPLLAQVSPISGSNVLRNGCALLCRVSKLARKPIKGELAHFAMRGASIPIPKRFWVIRVLNIDNDVEL
jgi:hypothetical protein